MVRAPLSLQPTTTAAAAGLLLAVVLRSVRCKGEEREKTELNFPTVGHSSASEGWREERDARARGGGGGGGGRAATFVFPWAELPILIAGQCYLGTSYVVHIIINIVIIVRYVARRRLSPLLRCRTPDVFLSAWMSVGNGV